MKRVICIVMALCMVLAMAACGNTQQELQDVAKENAGAQPAGPATVETGSSAVAGAGTYLETASFLFPYELDGTAKDEFATDFAEKMTGYLTTVGTTTVAYAEEADIVAALKSGEICAGIISLDTYAADSEGMTQMLIFEETGMTLCTSLANEGLNAIDGCDVQLQFAVYSMIANADDTSSYLTAIGVTTCTIPE